MAYPNYPNYNRHRDASWEERNDAEALKWFIRAAKSGNEKAKEILKNW